MAGLDILVFVLLFSAMAFVHELGHFLVAKRAGIKVEEFGFGLPPRLFAIRRGETEYSLNLIPVLAFVRLLGEEDPQDPRSFARAKKRWRTATLLAGPSMNLLLAVLLFATSFLTGWPTPTGTEVVIVQVTPGSPAESAGLQAGDAVLSLAGQQVSTSAGLRQVTEAHLGQEVPMRVRRGDAELTVLVRPRSTWPDGQGPVGIGIGDRTTRIEPVSYPPGQALVMGAERTVWVVGLTFLLPVLVVRGIIPLEMARPVSPVGIYQITSQMALESVSTGWWFPLLNWAAVLSAALGITNLMPIPGLDGGRLVFVILEAVRGRRISPQRESMVHFIGLAALLSLVVLVAYFELVNPIAIDTGWR